MRDRLFRAFVITFLALQFVWVPYFISNQILKWSFFGFLLIMFFYASYVLLDEQYHQGRASAFKEVLWKLQDPFGLIR